MNVHPGLEKYLNWLLNHSLQAGVLVLLVLLVQWIFRRQLTSRWRFALWWIVLVRLLLPFNPESAVSLFNFFQPSVRLEAPRYLPPVQATAPMENNLVQIASSEVSSVQTELPQMESRPATAPVLVTRGLPPKIQTAPSVPVFNRTVVRPHSSDFDDFLITGLLGVWLAGVLVLVGVVATQLIRFQRKLVPASAPADENLQRLLDDCQREFGVSRKIELLETDAVPSPALFGLLRLRLLLPRGLGAKFAGRELRYIFLHELAHVKRGDLWLNWLVTALQIMHWFNPLLWLGCARLRADRELACDELALLRAGDQAGTAYGETVVKLLENLNRPTVIPGLVGILEDKQQMRRRISMIANFRRPGRWSALAVFLIAAVAAAALTDAQTSKPAEQHIKVENEATDAAKSSPASTKSAGNYDETYIAVNNLPHLDGIATNSTARPDLTGTVSAKGGATLPVPATVFIATAAPKVGSSTFCPSCYADCSKHARADAPGNFKIEALDPQLTFQILAVAKGYKPKYVSKVDPAKGAPVKIELDPIESADAAPANSLRGRVVNPKGAPIEGAVVEMRGIETKDGGGRWGSLPDIDPLAVTDENGEFLITSKKPFYMAMVKITARRYADKNFNKLASGAARHQLVLTEGAAFTGRVLLDGKPLVGVSVGVSAVDRSSEVYLGHFEVGTGEHGNFVFVNLPPDANFHLYTLMGTMKKFGAVPPRQIHSGKDGGSTDAGDLLAGPAHRLAGRVVLSDGQPMPPKTRLLISREEAWDSMQITLDADGNFDTAGVPSEMVSLSARVKGYHVSARNLSVDQLNPFQMIGRVDRDITNLIFMLEKGPDPQPDYQHIDPEYGQSRERSLRGAEGVVDHSREWLVSGRVLDGETKQPVQNFRVTPGQTDNFNRTAWNTLRAVDGSNGVYLLYIGKRTAQPQLKLEADGYLPAGAELQPGDATNVDFILKKGNGPAGTVVTPDGKPAAGATVVLLKDEMNQAGLNSAGELTAYGNRSGVHGADTNGNFSFKPIFGMQSVAVASSNGFAIVSLETLATNSTITLAPFGKITGTLKRTSGPGTNEILDVRFADPGRPGLNQINLQTSTTTDAQGRFAFDRVPAGHLQITCREMMADGHGWAAPRLQEIDLKPGAALEVIITAADRAVTAEKYSYKPPQPKIISGGQVKGVVLLPDGKPAADADVALQVEGEYLAIGKGAFAASGAREKGLIVSAGQDGSFTLPLYEKAISVVALNEEGYAQISLEQLPASPQIQLQKWGRIEGTLRVGHHVGTNERIVVSAPQPRWSTMTFRTAGQTNNGGEITNASPAKLPPPIYDSNAFQARTDAQGRFVITFVPPGPQVLARLVPTGEGSWTHSQMGTVEVKPGETTQTNLGGTGRTIVGKVKFGEGETQGFTNGFAVISTPVMKYRRQIQDLKTDAERKAFYESEEFKKFQTATENRRSFSAAAQADGSFRAEDVLPGSYEVSFLSPQMNGKVETARSFVMFTSKQELVVPEAKAKDDDSSVDWGTVELKKFTIPIPEAAAGGK